jgi:hypothetical protein
LKSDKVCNTCPLKHSRGVKKAERKTWKVAMLRLEQSDKRLRKLQDAANKGHEAIETSFRQLGGKPKRPRKGGLNQIAASIVEQTQPARRIRLPLSLAGSGGLKGGKARHLALSKRRKSQIAKKAAAARCKKRK